MDALRLFETPVFVVDLPGVDALNAALAAELLAERARDPGLSVSNRGGWHSTPDLALRPSPALRELCELLVAHFRVVTTETARATRGAEPPHFGVALTAWAMVMQDGDYTVLHDHPQATWSSAYYVDAGAPAPDHPESGHLSFVDPRRAASLVQGLELFGGELAVPPRTGRLVIFPGYLQHCVHPYRGARPRIAVAANAAIRVAPRP